MGRVKDPVDLTYDQLGRNPPPEGDDLISQGAKAAREFFCTLYRDHPDAAWQQTDQNYSQLTGREALTQRMCRPIGLLPPPPTAPFTGGQCPHIKYQIEFTTQETAVQNVGFRQENVLRRYDVYGPVRGVRLAGTRILTYQGTYLKTYSTLIVDSAIQQPDGSWLDGQTTLQFFDQASNRGFNAVGGTSLVRYDGQPDNCGDPKPSYPQTQAPITNYNNTVNLTVANNVVVNAPITIVPTLIAPVGIVVRPEVNVDVGGLRFNFGLDGVRVTEPSGTQQIYNPDADPRINPPAPVYNDNSIDVGSDVDLQPVIQLLNKIDDELNKCCNRNAPFPSPDNIHVISLGNGNSGTVDLPERCFAVKVTITSDLSKMDTQSGDDGESVYQAGWVNFKNLMIAMPREQIQHASNFYMVPERFSGQFAWKMRKDYTCNVSCYTSPKQS